MKSIRNLVATAIFALMATNLAFIGTVNAAVGVDVELPNIQGKIGNSVTFMATATRSDNHTSVGGGKTVKFSMLPVYIGGVRPTTPIQLGTAMTNEAGVATLTRKLDKPAGATSYTATFIGDATFASTAISSELVILKAETALTSNTLGNIPGNNVTLSAVLSRTTDGNKLINYPVDFKIGTCDSRFNFSGTQCYFPAVMTDSSGRAKVNFRLNMRTPRGSYTVQAIFRGDNDYINSEGTATLKVK